MENDTQCKERAEKGMDNIILIGMPGSGKSSVGVVLAKALGYGFLDADLLIQERLTNEVKPREILMTTLNSQVYDMDYLAGVTGLKGALSTMITSASFETYSSKVTSLEKAAITPRGTGKLQMFVKNYTQS